MHAYIKSETCENGKRLILWSLGNYRYEIDVQSVHGEFIRQISVEAEYYEALSIFDKHLVAESSF
jgi:hypothetical protein